MTVAMIEAGPVTVRGPEKVPWQWGSAAVDCIDDAITLIDDEPVSVDALWADVLRAAVGTHCDSTVLVCPTWWTGDQIDRVRTAAGSALRDVADVVVMKRVDAWAAELRGPSWAVVEIAEELVVVARPDADPVTFVRSDTDDADVLAAAVVTAAAGADDVIVDAPCGVRHADVLGCAIAVALRHGDPAVSVVDAVRPARPKPLAVPETPQSAAAVKASGIRAPMYAGLAVAAVFAAFAVTTHQPAPVDESTVTMVEGRVAMQVPAGWTAERLTGGTGSARVQIVSPDDRDAALHLTQSVVAPGPAHQVPDTLRQALDEQPAGVFVDFNPHDRVAGREVISYRELRPQRHVRWIVLVDKAVRIAIGCQSAPQRAETIRSACDAAVRSAHAI